ncbi:MAG: Ig-like domain-containing protein, partial [Oscillospiraceae bacterium]|nr:Ig-like domain-containing protein [Oscillospiraceae bacterium]
GKVTVTANIEYNGKTYEKSIQKTLTGEETLPYSNVISTHRLYKKSEDWVQTIIDEGETAPYERDVRNITYDYTEGNYSWYGTTESKRSAAYCYPYEDAPDGRMRMYRKAGGWTGFRVMIPERGRYSVHLEAINYYSGEGASDVYVIPAEILPENAEAYLTEDYYVGTVDTLDPLLPELALKDEWIGEVNIPEAGEYAVIFRAKVDCYTTIRSVTFDGTAGMKKVELSAEKTAMEIDDEVKTSLSAYYLDGTPIPEENISVEYSSENPEIARVSDDGTITGKAEGTAKIIAKVTCGTERRSTYLMVSVKDNSGMKSAELTTFSDELYVGGKTKIFLLAHTNKGNKFSASLEEASFVIESEPEGILAVEDGCLVAKGEGTANVKANVTFRGETKESNILTFEIKPGTQKKRTTIYTQEMRENALENAKKYDWAKDVAKKAADEADKYLDKIDIIYDMIEPDNLPRSMTVGLVDDPNAYSCIYCGVDIRDTHGSYAWGVDPLGRPWQIQCPDCKRLFPSNDFASFYELGKDEYGRFELARARQLHHEMIFHKDGEECTHTAPTEEYTDEWYEFYGYGVEGGYLHNDMYGDVGKDLGVPENEAGRWGVDDGWGYATGEKASTGIPIRKSFIAFYNFALWSYAGPVKFIPNVIDSLRDAYLYTGDEKYGRAGAILIDRVADVYPGYDFYPYIEFQHSHGGKYTGKIDGSIWERRHAEGFSHAYDAFWPMMEDDRVIEYLSQKATELGLKNEKLTADMIRKNCEDGICREIFKAAKEAKIMGNFGYHQMAVANAAVALDSMPETQEMIDWLCAPSVITKTAEYKYGKKFTIYTENSGGETLSKIVSDISRDGFGAEVSEVYNQGWATHLIKLAELFYRYDKDSDLNLYNNPKFRKMLYSTFNLTMAGNYTLQVGDQYSTASTGNRTDGYNTLIGLERLEDESFAQMYYAIKKGNVESAYLDMFTDSEVSIEEKILDIVEWRGEITLPSRNFTEYGLAVVRAGEKLKGTSEKDLRRDVWMGYGNSSASHGHLDVLQMGIDAYGFNFTPDLGYPAATGNDPNRLQWVSNTLSHNTVVVDGVRQLGIYVGNPLHFDDAGKVSVIDVEAPEVYEQTDIYRRTLVSVQASNEVDYTVDFFRVKGGNEHIYSFHTQSFNGVTVDGLNLTAQNGGTYAGENTEYGNDPDTQLTNEYETRYPRGYTWLRNVQRDNAPEDGNFSVNFKQTDFNKQVSDSKGLNLKWTALNDWTPSSVGIATAEPPKLSQNKRVPELDYMLVHRKSEESLDTLFTSVIQPYKGEEYIESMESAALVSDGTEGEDDTAKAVKVKLKSGRADYIIYATNNGVTYTLTDGNVSFKFRGFVGVYSVNENGANIYAYVNDGDIIGNTEVTASISGKVRDFTREYVSENTITVELDNAIDAASLSGRYIYINNESDINGVYRIDSATVSGTEAVLDVGDVTLIKEYRDINNLELGFIYNISEGDSFEIPLSASEDVAPVFDEVENVLTTSAGSSITVLLNASSPAEESVSYIGTHLPRGASVESASGKVTWKPDSSQVGEHTFVITARDASGRESTTSFEVTVYGSTTGSGNKTEDNFGTSTDTPAGGGGGGGAAPTDKPDGATDTDNPDDESLLLEEKVPGAGEADEVENLRFTDLDNH